MAEERVGRSKGLLAKLSLAIVLVSTLAIGFSAGMLLERRAIAQARGRPALAAGVPTQAAEEFALLSEAWNTIQGAYVRRGDVDERQMTYGAIRDMVAALGDVGHSRFLSPEDRGTEHSATLGELEGIGAEIGVQDGRVIIRAPLDGSPAQLAGLKPGDIVMR